jgi:hypothetical protein
MTTVFERADSMTGKKSVCSVLAIEYIGLDPQTVVRSIVKDMRTAYL